MGVDLKALLQREPTTLDAFASRTVAIDAYNALYQFLSTIRGPDGSPLSDEQGRVTSHLSGLLHRNANYLALGIRPVYVFDGTPPSMKAAEIARRRAIKKEATVKYERAIEAGDAEAARKYAQQTTAMTDGMVGDAKRLLGLLGIPHIDAPSEGEAAAAHLTRTGEAYASASQDFDSVLFGASRLVRNFATSGRRKLPNRNQYVNVEPELIESGRTLKSLGPDARAARRRRHTDRHGLQPGRVFQDRAKDGAQADQGAFEARGHTAHTGAARHRRLRADTQDIPRAGRARRGGRPRRVRRGRPRGRRVVPGRRARIFGDARGRRPRPPAQGPGQAQPELGQVVYIAGRGGPPAMAAPLAQPAGDARWIMRLKRGLAGSYRGSSHLYEAVPSGACEMAGVDSGAAASLGAFARANPVYTALSEADICGVRCTVCEGDATGHWLDSLKHDASAAPFYPTWMLSAHALARASAALGARAAVDVGSGDGRIAYCCRASTGMRARSIEIDGGLAALQRRISELTGVDIGASGSGEDAFGIDYWDLAGGGGGGGGPVAFFVGALPQVGELLAEAVVASALGGGGATAAAADPRREPLFVLAGAGETASGGVGGAASRWGWGPLLDRFGLRVAGMLELPTRWTLESAEGTPYVFASRAAHQGGRPGL